MENSTTCQPLITATRINKAVISYKPKVSVVIPVYNVEEYLREMLDCVVSQTLQEIEIICVDDGSTDSSLDILMEYANKDARISIITSPNLFAGVARNTGLAFAQGETIIWLDADDTYNPHMLEKLYEKLKQADAQIAFCQYKRIDLAGNVVQVADVLDKIYDVFSPQDTDNILTLFSVPPYNKLYDLAFIQKYNLQYFTTKISNDVGFSFKARLLATRIAVVHEVLAQHRNLSNTSCTKVRGQYTNYVPFSMEDIYIFMEENGLLLQYKDRLKQFLKRTYYYELSYYSSRTVLEQFKTNLFACKHYTLLEDFFQKILPQQIINAISIPLVEHCNLNCKSCDHFAPLAKKSFACVEQFEEDIKKFATLSKQKLNILKLMGGEPLLHPKIKDFMKISRQYLPHTKIQIVSNGILLMKQKEDFWQACQQFQISISLTKYPIPIQYDEMEQLSKDYGVGFEYFNQSSSVKTVYHLPLDVHGAQSPMTNFLYCFHANNCVTIKNGRLYTCTVAPNIEHFNVYFNLEFEENEKDYIKLSEAESIDEILKFLANPIPFCKYCNVKNRTFGHEWCTSKKKIEEWI